MRNLTPTTLLILTAAGLHAIPPSGETLSLQEEVGPPGTIRDVDINGFNHELPVVEIKTYGALVGRLPHKNEDVIVVNFPPLIQALRASGHKGGIYTAGMIKRQPDGTAYTDCLRAHP